MLEKAIISAVIGWIVVGTCQYLIWCWLAKRREENDE